jgi:hypothetical protein
VLTKILGISLLKPASYKFTKNSDFVKNDLIMVLRDLVWDTLSKNSPLKADQALLL